MLLLTFCHPKGVKVHYRALIVCTLGLYFAQILIGSNSFLLKSVLNY